MARVPLTILIPTEVHDRLKYTAMTSAVARCACEILDRWRRRREDGPRPNDAVTYMEVGTAADVPGAEVCTAELALELDTATAETLARFRPQSLTMAEYAAFLLTRWSQWHDEQAKAPKLHVPRLNGVAE